MKKLAVVLVALWATVLGAAETEKPRDVGLVEKLTTQLSQVRVLVTPKDGNLAACNALVPSNFSLTIERKPVPLVAVDQQGASKSISNPNSEEALQFVAILFDEWDLGCPQDQGDESARARALASVREWLAIDNSSVRAALITLGDDLTVLSGFQTLSDARRTFAAFEERTLGIPQIKAPHVNRQKWWELMRSTMSILGQLTREPKDLMVIAAGVPVDITNTGEQSLLAAEAQRNQVRINTFDPIWDKRVLPIGLSPLAEIGGGSLFSNGATVSTAVSTIEATAQCTFALSFKTPELKKPRAPLAVSLDRPEFLVRAPSVFGAEIEQTESDDLQVFLAAEEIELGIRIEPFLIPVRDLGDTMEVQLGFKISTTRPLAADDVGSIAMYGAVWHKAYKNRAARVYANFGNAQIRGKTLETLTTHGEVTLKFPGVFTVPESTLSIVVGARSLADDRTKGSRQLERTVAQLISRSDE